MFIFTTNQDLWARELMGRIMSCDHSLGRNHILKFILLFYDLKLPPTWEESVKRDLNDWCITKELALDRREWKLAIHVSEG
jgi:hypothetical protein